PAPRAHAGRGGGPGRGRGARYRPARRARPDDRGRAQDRAHQGAGDGGDEHRQRGRGAQPLRGRAGGRGGVARIEVFHVKRRDTLHRYCELLAAAPVSLTSIRDPAALWRVHVEDALTALDVIGAPPESLVDVGSGGGAPGIPLAVELDVAPVLL